MPLLGRRCPSSPQRLSLIHISLDDGEPCVCVQGISYSLLCNWFRNAVLPADHELLADVMRERPGKCCAVCGKPVYSSSNRAKYCPACAKQERRKQDLSLIHILLRTD